MYCNDCNRKVSIHCENSEEHALTTDIQKGVDVGIATLALIHVERYDTLVLSTGDADLLDAVEYLSERGKRIELLVFDAGVSAELQSRADRVHWINDFADQIRQD
jgi:uncharacterized LabA/DUF88 family protein